MQPSELARLPEPVLRLGLAFLAPPYRAALRRTCSWLCRLAAAEELRVRLAEGRVDAILPGSEWWGATATRLTVLVDRKVPATAAAAALARVLAACPEVTALEMSAQLWEACAAALPGDALARLRVLRLQVVRLERSAPLAGASMEELPRLCPLLEELALAVNEPVLGPLLAGLPRLQRLSVLTTGLTPIAGVLAGCSAALRLRVSARCNAPMLVALATVPRLVELSLAADAGPLAAPALARFAALQVLHASGDTEEGELVALAAVCPALTELRARGRLTAGGLAALAAARPELQRLECELQRGFAGPCPALPRLRRLTLFGDPQGNALVARGCPGLERAELQLSPSGLATVLHACQALTRLSLTLHGESGTPTVNFGETRLRRLKLQLALGEKTELLAATLRRIAETASAPVALGLFCSDLPPDLVALLGGPRLRLARLDCWPAAEAELLALAAAAGPEQRLRWLGKLALRGAGVTDACVAALLAIPGTAVARLHLECAPAVTDAALAHVAANAVALRWLCVFDCAATPTGIAGLREACPLATVVS